MIRRYVGGPLWPPIPFMNGLVINNISWKIKPVKMAHRGLYRGNGKYAIGMTDWNDRIIYLNENLSGTLLYNVLCHEIVHAFMFSYDLYLDYEQEEKMANFIADYGKEIVNNTDSILWELCHGYKMC